MRRFPSFGFSLLVLLATGLTTTALEAQSITIAKDAIPFGPQDFSFSGDLGAFDLDDDSNGTLPGFMTFTPAPGTYVVTEAPVEGWLLTDLSCDDGDSSVDLALGTATIVYDGVEDVTCTFENSLLGKIIIDKQTLPVGDPTSFDFDMADAFEASVASFSLADQDAPFEIFLLPGGYFVDETVPLDWALIVSFCDNEDLPSDITLFAGDTITCTFINETTVVSDVDFDKAFAPVSLPSPDSTIGPGSTTTLTFTIDNTLGAEPAQLLTFEDILPVGMTIAAVPEAFSNCGPNSIIDAPPGGGTIKFSFGGVGVGEVCTVSVNVTAVAIDASDTTYMNSSSELTSSDGKSDLAEDDLVVDVDRPGFSKEFSPSTISLGGISTLTFTIDNDDNAAGVTSLFFRDDLPPGLVVASPANIFTDCGPSAEVTVGPGESIGGDQIFLSGGTLGAGASCTVSVDVTAEANGTFENVSGQLELGSPFDAASGFATAVLDVPLEFLTKTFVDDPVSPGNTVTLRFIVTNLDRDFPATAIAFDDGLDPLGSLTGLAPSGALPTDPCGAGSSLAFAAGTGTLSLTGGTLGPGGDCEFLVDLLVPAGADDGIFTNTTDAISATVDGETVVGNMASDDLVVSLAPVVTKEFIDDPAAAGGTVTLRFTLTNLSTATGFEDIDFTDDLNTAIPQDADPSLPPPALAANGLVGIDGNADPVFDVCGTGSELTLLDPPDITFPFPSVLPADPSILIISDAILAPAGTPGDSCTFDVVLDIREGVPAGIYTNTTSDITGTQEFFETPFVGAPVSGDVEIIGAPTLRKEFLDDPVGPSETVTLQFTISHDEAAPGDATLIAFTDDLAALDPAIAGLAATGLPLVGACNGTGTLSGTTLLDFSGGTLAPGEECTFTATLAVPAAAAPGPHTNTTSAIVATVDGVAGVTGDVAIDDLDIDGLVLTKEFLDDPVLPGDTVTLEFVIENLHPTETATSISISDDMAAILGGSPDITAADGTTVTDVCGPGNGTISWSFGDTFMSFMGGTLTPGEMCTFSVVLLVPGGAASGTYVNTTGAGEDPGFSASMPATVIFEEATDLLVIDNFFIGFTKAFSLNPVAPGGTTTLEFTITNLDPDDAIVGIGFTDDLEATLFGLEATGAPTNTCGGMAAGGFPTSFFDYSDGALAGGASCTIELTLDVPALPLGTLAFNETSVISGTLGVEGPLVLGDPATAELRLGFLTLEKAFDGPTKAGETVDLTFTITNLDTASVVDLGFTDDLEAVVPGLVATGLPFATCGGSLFSPDGGSTVVLAGAGLAAAGSPGDSCMFTATLAVPGMAPFGTFTNTTSDLMLTGVSVGDPAVADLVIEPPIDFSKVFLPDTIGPGSTTQLLFTIANIDSGALAEDLEFSDNLPAGVVIATPSSAFTDCVDGILSAPDGGTTIGVSGARVGIGETCTAMVNVTAAAPGTYDNVSGELTSTAGSGGMAAATLTVDAELPGFSKGFAPGLVTPGGTSTLTLTIDNSLSSSDVASLDFTDLLPTGLVIATPSNATTDCSGGLGPAFLSAAPGTGVITLSASGSLPGSPSLLAGETCSVVVDVTAASDDLYENVSGELFTEGLDEGTVGFATAELDVREGFLVKSFTDDPVPPGGTVTLEFTINNPSRTEPATDIEFTDDLDAVLPGAPDLMVSGLLPTDPCGAGSTLTVEPVNVLTLAGGNLPAEGSCTFSVTVTVPVGSATGIHLNTTSAISATIDGITEIGDPAVDDLRVVGFPILTKEFLDAATDAPDPVVGAGDDVKIRFTITNTSTTSAATGIAFSDDLSGFFPLGGTSVLPATPCGGGSSVSIVDGGFSNAVLLFDGGVLAAAGMAGDSCTFDVILTLPTGLATGTYVNTTSEITATVDGEAVAGFPASDTFDVVAAPRLTKEFTDDPVQPGDPVTLEFTLEHDANAPGDATDVTFTDDLAIVIPGLFATGLPLMDLCGPGNGMLVGTAMDTLLTFSGATLTPGEVCTFSVMLSVPLTADAGPHTNTTSNVVATVLGLETTETPGQDDLMVGGLLLTKEFTDDPVIAGNPVTLEFVITNQSPDPVTDIFFEDLLDPDVLAGLSVVLPLPIDPCGPGSLLEVFSAPEVIFPPTPAIDEALRLTGGNLGPTGPLETDGVCKFSVTLDVPAGTASGTYVNRTRDFEATAGGSTVPFPDATDDLVVANEQLLLTKEFTDDPVVPGGTVTLEFGISTLGASDSASELAFTDDLDATLTGLVATGLPVIACGGTLSSPDGGMTIEFSGGSFTEGDCGISVTLAVPAAVPFGGTFTNTTSGLTGKIEGSPVTGEPASDDLMVDFFTFTKSFDGPTGPGMTPVLTFTIENLSTTDSVQDLEFSDDLDLVVPGLVATGLLVEPCGVSSAIAGTSFLTLTGGNLLPGGSCTFSVDLTVPLGAPGGTFVNTTSDLFQDGLSVAAPATADLEVNSPPTFGKVFVPETVGQGFDSTLTFTIDNSVNSVAVTDLTFLDTLPVDLLVSMAPAVTNTCGGAVVAMPGLATISLAGGTLDAGASCMISVRVFAPSDGVFINTTDDLTSSLGNSGTATATLTVAPCLATDGANLTLSGPVFVSEVYEVCNSIELEHILVLGPDGKVTLRAGVAVIFVDGVEFELGSELVIEIDPTLIP